MLHAFVVRLDVTRNFKKFLVLGVKGLGMFIFETGEGEETI